MKTNTEFKNEALSALKGNWAPAVLATLLYFAVVVVMLVPYCLKYVNVMQDPTNLDALKGTMGWWAAGMLGVILVGGPLYVGLVNAFKLLLSKGENRLVDSEVRIGFGNWLHHVWGFFLRILFIALWSLLFFIPGIIKSLSYAMTHYILVDYPELSAWNAITLSQEMMKGHKYDLLYLYLGFAGWYLLCILTLGIGYFWFIPYVQTAQSSFYYEVKAEWEARRAAAA